MQVQACMYGGSSPRGHCTSLWLRSNSTSRANTRTGGEFTELSSALLLCVLMAQG
ncbi:hypothetical protein Sjap_013830 [Stephania japonica]|uniref:Uncharacterized protein n=1 Tax=Stephania japonica TaxID=461633 RepID=A0AAP0IYS9_9MAGN